MMKYWQSLAIILLLFGCTKDKILPGERELVLGTEIGLEVDTALASEQMQLPQAAPNINWTQFMGSPDHVALNPQINFERKRPFFRRKIGKGDKSGLFLLARPVIFADTLYWMDRKFNVSALKLQQKGKQAWQITLPIPRNDKRSFGGGLVVNAELLIVTTGAGRVFGIRRSDGSLLWQRNIQYPIHSAPSLAGNEVFFTSINNHTFALNAATGALIWVHEYVDTRAGFIGSATPAIHENIVVTGYSTGEIIALERGTGKLIWKQPLAQHSRIDSLAQVTDIVNGFVIDNGAVFAGGSSGRFAALELTSGRILWEIPLAVNAPVAALGEYLFLLNDKSILFAVFKRNGSIRWTQELQNWVAGKENYQRIVWSGPVLATPYLVLNNSQKEVKIFHVENGREEKRYKFGSGFYLSPIGANQVLYFISSAGYLYGLR